MLCSIGTQCKLHKDKVQNKSQMDGTEQCWGRDKMAAIFQHIFMNENVWISIKISLKFVPKCQINNIQALVQVMAWSQPGWLVY